MKKIFTLVAAIVCSGMMVMAQDTRQVVNTVTLTTANGSIESYFSIGTVWSDSYGDEVISTISKPSNAPYRLSGAVMNKIDDETFTRLDDLVELVAGKYAFQTQVRLDGTNGTLYRFPADAADLTVTVDGAVVQVNEITDWGDVSFFWLSMEFTLVPSALDVPEAGELKAVKRIKDGQIVIERNGKNFDLTGKEL